MSENGNKINEIRTLIRSSIVIAAKSSPLEANKKMSSLNLGRLKSIERSGAELTVGAMFSDPSNLGTFDDATPIQITVGINGYSSDRSLTERKSRLQIPQSEQVEWVRAVLGKEISDYAYRALALLEQLENRPAFYIVLLDQKGNPRLAPEDFNWDAVGSGGHWVRPIKISPSQDNRELRSWLKTQGDLSPVDPRNELDDRDWSLAVVSRIVDDLRRTRHDKINEYRLGNIQWNEKESCILIEISFHDFESKARRSFGIRVNCPGFRVLLREQRSDARPEFAASVLIGGLSPASLAHQESTLSGGVNWISVG